MKKTCLLLFAFLFAIEMSSQCTVMPTNLKQRTTESDLIIEGKIINSNSFFGDEINMIFTKYEIEVFRIFKGEVNTSTVEMISTGGIVGDRMLIATPSFEGKLGEVGIFMIKKQPSAGIINGQKYINKGVAPKKMNWSKRWIISNKIKM